MGEYTGKGNVAVPFEPPKCGRCGERAGFRYFRSPEEGGLIIAVSTWCQCSEDIYDRLVYPDWKAFPDLEGIKPPPQAFHFIPCPNCRNYILQTWTWLDRGRKKWWNRGSGLCACTLKPSIEVINSEWAKFIKSAKPEYIEAIKPDLPEASGPDPEQGGNS